MRDHSPLSPEERRKRLSIYRGKVIDPALEVIMGRRPVFASLLRYLRAAGFPVPGEILDQDPRPAFDALFPALPAAPAKQLTRD